MSLQSPKGFTVHLKDLQELNTLSLSKEKMMFFASLSNSGESNGNIITSHYWYGGDRENIFDFLLTLNTVLDKAAIIQLFKKDNAIRLLAKA